MSKIKYVQDVNKEKEINNIDKISSNVDFFHGILSIKRDGKLIYKAK